jgi:hypothetical protein
VKTSKLLFTDKLLIAMVSPFFVWDLIHGTVRGQTAPIWFAAGIIAFWAVDLVFEYRQWRTIRTARIPVEFYWI